MRKTGNFRFGYGENFRRDETLKLKDALIDMGMESAFEVDADFSGIATPAPSERDCGSTTFCTRPSSKFPSPEPLPQVPRGFVCLL